MDDQTFVDVAAALKKAKKSPKPYHWFFCAAGSDGAPVLLVGKREGEIRAQGKAQKKDATDKKGGRGRVIVGGDGELVLGLEEGNLPAKQVQRTIRTKLAVAKGFAKVKGLLQKATVMEAEAFAALAGAAEAPATGTQAEQVEAVQKRLEKVRGEAKAAFDQAAARVGKEHDDLVALSAVQVRAKAARDKGLAAISASDLAAALEALSEAADLYEEIRDGAASAGTDDVGVDVEEDEDEGEEQVPSSSTTETPVTPVTPTPKPKPTLRQEVPTTWSAEKIETDALFDALVDVHKDLFDGRAPTTLPGVSFAILSAVEVGTVYVKAQVWNEREDGVFDPKKNKEHLEMAKDMAPAAVTIVPGKDPDRTVYFNQEYFESRGKGKVPDYDEVNAIMLHESHHAASKGFVNEPFFSDDHQLSWKLDECVTDYFTKKVWDRKYPGKEAEYLKYTSYFTNPSGRTGWFGDVTSRMLSVVPEKTLAAAYFAGDTTALGVLRSKETELKRLLA